MDQNLKTNNAGCMSLMNTAAAATTDNQIIPPNHGLPQPAKKKKRPSLLHAVKVAIFMFRRRSRKSKTIQFDATSKLTNFISSVRPLHVENNIDDNRLPRIEDHPEDANGPISLMMSPAHTCYTASEGVASAYASASNLLELDPTGNEDDQLDDSYFDDKGSDYMIDSKAEEFIAQFYQQMKIQHEAYKTSTM